MRIVAQPDGVVNRKDRAIWWTFPFDQQWTGAAPVTHPPLGLRLIDALAVALRNDLNVGELFGSIWTDEAPISSDDAPVDYPLAVLTDPAESYDTWQSQDEDASVEYFGSPTIQISIYATGRRQAQKLGVAMLAAVKAVQALPIAFDDGVLLHLRPTGMHTEKDPDKGPDGADLWQCVTLFIATVSHTQALEN